MTVSTHVRRKIAKDNARYLRLPPTPAERNRMLRMRATSISLDRQGKPRRKITLAKVTCLEEDLT